MGIVPVDRTLEIILTALVAILGGGKVWDFLQARGQAKAEAVKVAADAGKVQEDAGKARADAQSVAVDTALEAMTQAVSFLKTRVVELSCEIEAERKARRDSERQMNYFQSQLEDMHIENKRLKEQLASMSGGRRVSDVQLKDLEALRAENERLHQEVARLHDEIAELRATVEARQEPHTP